MLLEAGELRHHVEELLHARLDAGADVHQQAAALVDRAHERVDDVVDVHEVAGLRAVAEDHRPLVAEQLAREDRDDARLAVRVLARAVHVGQRERGVLEAADRAVVVEVVADGLLRDAVRRLRDAAAWPSRIGISSVVP